MGLVGCGGEEAPETIEYSLTISSTEGGSVITPGEGILTYDEGTDVDLVAVAEEGYRFVNWSGDVSSIADLNAASISVTMNGDYSIAANFIAQYVLTIDSTDGGEVTAPGEGTFTYDTGAVVVLVAEPEEGYKFVNWTGDVATVANTTLASTTIMMDDDCAVTANFVLDHVYLDKIGPGLWGLGIGGQGIEAMVTEEGVVVNFSSAPVDDPQAEPPQFGGYTSSMYLLEGDFDIRLTYELLTWPQGSGVRVGLGVYIPNNPDKFVNVERVGFGRDDFPDEPREVYLTHFGWPIYAITGTNDLSGALRILREGAIVSCFYGAPNDWHELHEAEWSTDDVRISFSTWSHEQHFGGEEVRVLMHTLEIVEPAL